ncbi:MAG: hypothetical protein QNK05_12745 [Myxococcota bacterium]|nr:hypothetical protein [Myxococcota bacterium]
MSEAPRPRRSAPAFRPNFLLVVLYVGGFMIFFGVCFALPALIEGARALPPGPGELSEAELEQARDIVRGALSGGRLILAFVAAGAAVGAGIWTRTLPGFRNAR